MERIWIVEPIKNISNRQRVVLPKFLIHLDCRIFIFLSRLRRKEQKSSNSVGIHNVWRWIGGKDFLNSWIEAHASPVIAETRSDHVYGLSGAILGICIREHATLERSRRHRRSVRQ